MTLHQSPGERLIPTPVIPQAKIRKATASDIIRGLGLLYGPTLLLNLFAGSSLVLSIISLLPHAKSTGAARRLQGCLLLGTAGTTLYLALVRPWMKRWGATEVETKKPLPGDELVPEPGVESTRAVTVNAPASRVWSWLVQIGQDRGGFYSYTWLENLAGAEMKNADRIHPEWQQLNVGELIRLAPMVGLPVAILEPGHALVLRGWGAFVVEPIDAQTTRLIARSRTPKGWAGLNYALFVELPHFIMERKMLLGLKERAEKAG